ncbi:TcpQ domain-containing protein [Crenobacter sp. SG2305]|uniref:TcpQ domain-containing protein n=1 Tax=Crenobacter oryzisoli TaxID=3056844 RepID=UPI0025AACEA6|nr:TcpQ domain-containing protein [Crenobacter sp. SG2305]MDN0082480.1 TcpQ domain-containing protein [Crenobacter sp. SG2305]
MATSKLKITVIAASIAMMPAVGFAATFGFQYQLKGDLLAQAFDDGHHTYLQSNRAQPVDMVFAIDEQGNKTPIAIQNRQPYIEVDGVYRQLEIQAGGKKTLVQYTGNETRSANIEAAIPSARVPSATYALVAGQRADSPAYPSSSQVAMPAQIYGEAQALNIDDNKKQAAADGDQDVIPFVVGKTTLGSHGRKILKDIAERASGKHLKIVVMSDTGRGISQARARGIALRKEFAKYGVTDITWLNGGDAKAVGGLQKIKVAVEAPQSAPAVAANVVTPKLMPQSVKPVEALPANMSGQAADEAALTAQISAAEAEYTQATKRIQELESQGLLSNAESGPAKQRLAAKRDATVRVAQQSLDQIQSRKAAAKAAEEQRLAQVEPIQPATPPLTIKATPLWAITETDTSLRTLLQKWAKTANWEVKWDVATDFAISAKATLRGNLDSAVNQVLASLQSSETPIVATFYEGNRIIKISPKDQI